MPTMMTTTDNDHTLSKFDRVYAGLLGGNSLTTKPATIEEVQNVTGETETYIIQTVRDEKGDHVVVKFLDKQGPMRIILPPRVCNLIAVQRDRLTAKRRSIASKAVATARMERGEMPGFMKAKA